MTTTKQLTSINRTAKLAGVLTLLIAVIAPFSMLYLPSILIVPGDAAATTNQIMASLGLFRLGIVSDAAVVLLEVVLTVLLYVLLKQVNPTLALVAAFARLAMTVIQGINLLNYGFVLALLGGSASAGAFAPPQLQSLVLLFLDAHKFGGYIWEIFFGLHLVVLGYLVFKAGYLPRILGVLLVLGALGYLMESFANVLVPNNPTVAAVYGVLLGLAALAELSFALWLALKGVNVERMEKSGLALAGI